MPKPKPIYEGKINIRTGDTVVVISGAAKSSEPRKVLSVLRDENKVVVEGVTQKDRKKPTGPQSSDSGIVDKPLPIHRSNVALVDPQTGKRTRVKTVLQDGKRVRVAKSGATI